LPFSNLWKEPMEPPRGVLLEFTDADHTFTCPTIFSVR
jgi:hypothetical protein